jgi:hypothetical protein
MHGVCTHAWQHSVIMQQMSAISHPASAVTCALVSDSAVSVHLCLSPPRPPMSFSARSSFTLRSTRRQAGSSVSGSQRCLTVSLWRFCWATPYYFILAVLVTKNVASKLQL